MNALAVDIREDVAHAAQRLICAALLAALLFSLSIALAGAEKTTTWTDTRTQNQFVNDCRFVGATPKREATHVVSCTTSNGTKHTCDFNTKPANCTTTKPAANGSITSDHVNASAANGVNQTMVSSDSETAPVSDAAAAEGAVTEATTSENPAATTTADDSGSSIAASSEAGTFTEFEESDS